MENMKVFPFTIHDVYPKLQDMDWFFFFITEASNSIYVT